MDAAPFLYRNANPFYVSRHSRNAHFPSRLLDFVDSLLYINYILYLLGEVVF